MNCDRAAELMPDYFQGTLNHEGADELDDHMEKCAACRETVAMWNDLALLPEEQPSPASRERFQAMLAAYQEGRSSKTGLHAGPRKDAVLFWGFGNWGRAMAAGLACALALLAIGFLAGRYANNSDFHAQAELAAVHTELTNMRQLVVLSMLQQQSATERLQGITWSTQEAQADPQVLAALVHTLRYDSSVDVRLAALDALGRHGNQPQVRAGLLDALQAQQSPLVQVAVIDLIVELRDTKAIEELQKVQQDPSLNPAVRERAQWAIRKLI
jgi:anti-sigma factor RsiW